MMADWGRLKPAKEQIEHKGEKPEGQSAVEEQIEHEGEKSDGEGGR